MLMETMLMEMTTTTVWFGLPQSSEYKVLRRLDEVAAIAASLRS